MSIVLTLPHDLERRLTEEAAQRGLSVEAYAVELLHQRLPTRDRQAQLVALLQSWIDQGDVVEHQETGEYLIQMLDEDRLSDRKLFPPERKGVTW